MKEIDPNALPIPFYGTAFQDFFSTVMEKLHGDDFIRVRPLGRMGRRAKWPR